MSHWMSKVLNLSQHSADSLFGLANVAAIIGGVLVVIGTAGIFWLGSVREHYADQRLQANELATATANREAATSQERNTALKIELEKERSERLRLEDRLAPRHLAGSQRETFKSTVRPYARTKINIGVAHNNAEGEALRGEIRNALMEAGWQSGDISSATEFGASYPDGITVLVAPQKPDTLHPIVLPMARAFQGLGLSAEPAVASDPMVTMGMVKIAVGFKPGRNG